MAVYRPPFFPTISRRQAIEALASVSGLAFLGALTGCKRAGLGGSEIKLFKAGGQCQAVTGARVEQVASMFAQRVTGSGDGIARCYAQLAKLPDDYLQYLKNQSEFMIELHDQIPGYEGTGVNGLCWGGMYRDMTPAKIYVQPSMIEANGTLLHELGHALNNHINDLVSATLKRAVVLTSEGASESTGENLLQDTYNAITNNQGTNEQNNFTNSYGLSNPVELWAESFAEFYCDQSHRDQLPASFPRVWSLVCGALVLPPGMIGPQAACDAGQASTSGMNSGLPQSLGGLGSFPDTSFARTPGPMGMDPLPTKSPYNSGMTAGANEANAAYSAQQWQMLSVFIAQYYQRYAAAQAAKQKSGAGLALNGEISGQSPLLILSPNSTGWTEVYPRTNINFRVAVDKMQLPSGVSVDSYVQSLGIFASCNGKSIELTVGRHGKSAPRFVANSALADNQFAHYAVTVELPNTAAELGLATGQKDAPISFQIKSQSGYATAAATTMKLTPMHADYAVNQSKMSGMKEVTL